MTSANLGHGSEEVFAQLQAGWANQMIDSLVQSGVRDAVVCPGSRSTPLVLALSANQEIRCTSIADERSAAFFALGQAKVSDVPSVLVMTSGSAIGHVLPAAMESAASRVPLLVVSANRPVERENCEAAQTTDQRRIFGVHSRGFFEVGIADSRSRSLRAVARTVAQAVALTQWPQAGPVQIDVRARKPLQMKTLTEASSEGSCLTPVLSRPSVRADFGELVAVAQRLSSAKRPLVVAGPASMTAQKIRPLAQRLSALGIPCAFERTSQLQACCNHQTLTTWMQSRTFRSRVRPDFVLQLGGAPLNGGWEPWIESLVETDGVEHCILATSGMPDPVSTARTVLVGELGPALETILESVSSGQGWDQWCQALLRLEAAGVECLRRSVEVDRTEDGIGQERITEGRAARLACSMPKDGALLAFGNSLAVRLAEAYGGDGPLGPVWHQRGLNGIDGIVSGVAGSLQALAQGVEWEGAESAPLARLLIGDVSLLHDLTGLGLLRQPACGALDVVVIDNDGGRIFDRLPVQNLGLSSEQRDLFGTPQKADFEAAAAVYGLTYAYAETDAQLASALDQRPAVEGARLIHVGTDPGREALDHAELIQALETSMLDVWADGS